MNISRCVLALGPLLLGLSVTPVTYAADGLAASEAPCYKLPDAKAAVAACTVAAAQGHTGAAYRLARIYNTGMGAQRDMKQAAMYYKRAGELGYVHANYLYAIQFFEGDEQNKDPALVYRYMRLAADRGSASAQAFLAFLHQNGEGVKLDSVEAWTRYELAVRGVQTNAAYVRANEVPLQRDRPDELSWRQSEISNLSNIAEIRDSLGKQMSRKQLEDAKLRADAWRVNAS